jgi:hypothetical protein
MMTIAKGSQGKWFATTRTGENLPCLKRQFMVGVGQYHEPHYYDPSQRRNVEYIDAVKQGRVLIASYKDGVRDGYLGGIFTIEDVQHDETGLRCRIVSKQKIG